MNEIEKLFGKPLQTLVTQALLNLHNSKESVLIREISQQIEIDRPDLKTYIANDQKNLHKRIFNCIKKLEQADLIKTKKISAKVIGTNYYIIFTKLN